MTEKADLKGVYCAIVTPLRNDAPDLSNLQRHVQTLAEEGCDGLLLLGTTGEGPSLAMAEREAIVEAAIAVAGNMRVVVGTGFPSLTDAVTFTRRAFALGADAAVVIPPYYFKKFTDQGLFDFYRRLFDEAVPDDGLLMVYHIPQVSAVPISFDLIEKLVDYAGDRMAGIKDSGGDLTYAQEVIRRFPTLRTFTGTDAMLLRGLEAGAAGCITAAANVLAPLSVEVYRAYTAGEDATERQQRLTAARGALDRYQPAAAMLKSLLALRYGTDGWDVRPPLEPVSAETRAEAIAGLTAQALPPALDWLRQTTP